jgi:hypothetical protein
MINMLLTEGQTSLASVLKRNYEHYSDRFKHHRFTGTDRIRYVRRVISIDELQCTKLLSSLYPSEFDLVRTEMNQWIQNFDIITLTCCSQIFMVWFQSFQDNP